MVNARIGRRSTRADLGRGGDLQQSVQAALIELREAEEFDSELPTFTPTDRGGLDRNGRTQISRLDEDSHRWTGLNRRYTGDGASSGRQIEHCAFANVWLIGAGEEDLHVNGDSWIFTTLDHASSIRFEVPRHAGTLYSG
jgi:hypothetical protein